MKNFDYKSIFLNSNEEFICALGNDYLQNFLAGGGLTKGFAVLSDKRVYFKGKCFVKNGIRYSKSTEERIVDVKDVTGSGFINKNPIWALVVSIYFFICIFTLFLNAIVHTDSKYLVLMFFNAAFSGIFYYIYKSLKHNFFQIQYAGGVIAFETKWYGVDEAQKFQKALRLEKDKYEKSKERISNDKNSSADELKKYSELLNSGAITQDEFKTIKERIFNNP